jgi:hypothetical protein
MFKIEEFAERAEIVYPMDDKNMGQIEIKMRTE